MLRYPSPGVYKEEFFPEPAAELRTGVPVFLGFAARGPVNTPKPLTLWPEFEQNFGRPLPNGFLAYSVRGFFENGGQLCYVVRLEDRDKSLSEEVLDGLASLDDVDLICAPDIVRPRLQGEPPSLDEVVGMQAAILNHCETLGNRFAILDSRREASISEVKNHLSQLRTQGRSGENGALYYPWIRVQDGPPSTNGFIPPCGHMAGVYARTDQRVGVHKAPANEVLQGVVDLAVNLTNVQQGELNPEGVNALRAFPGRGIRVWGARTLAGADRLASAWKYVPVRRLFLTAVRWIERNMTAVVFEPHDTNLWARIERDLNAYFDDLFRQGALKGDTPQEAFHVKCDAETNPPEVRDQGQVVTEIGLAPAQPNEFIIVRIIQGIGGAAIVGPVAG
jgi:hypothetical protein